METKWYAITQLMIWQVADQGGEYYFTDSLNGNRVNYYQTEINEINYLVDSYNTIPSINNNEYTTVENSYLTIQDNNNVIHNYTTENKELTINNKFITIDKLKEGTYEFSLYREEDFFNTPIIFYQSNNSQNLIKTGDLNKQTITFKVNVIKTKINLTKIDKDNQSILPQGEASLDGAIYTLYDTNFKEIQNIEIKNNQAEFNNLLFGKYYIQEKSSGKGYLLNDNIYEINITKNSPINDLILENKVIKKKIIIEKKYGENNNFIGEKNINFEIYNNKNELIKTISTDDNGKVEIILPYGKYTIKQINTTKGYSKIEPFEINIDNTEEEIIELKDYKIKVPNTHINKYNNFLSTIIQILLIILW